MRGRVFGWSPCRVLSGILPQRTPSSQSFSSVYRRSLRALWLKSSRYSFNNTRGGDYQFFVTLPNDLLDAARVDGAGEFGIFARIVIPLAKPALAALSIFTFQGYWNDFVWPLVITTDDSYRTIQLGLTVFRQRFSTEWGPLMAGVTIATVPMVAVFLSAQRYFVSGIALTGLKG